MLMLVSGATATKRRHPTVGTLIEPAGWAVPDGVSLRPGRWAMDNGAYSGFDAAAYMDMLQRFRGRRGCLFVTAPDVVGDAAATLSRWPFWSDVIRGVGFVPALVLQDGMLASEVPWRSVGAVFVGGTTEWKLGPQAATLVGYARTRGLWAHMGRVNSFTRISYAREIGCLSFDGSKYSQWPETHIPGALAHIERINTPLPLFS